MDKNKKIYFFCVIQVVIYLIFLLIFYYKPMEEAKFEALIQE